MITAEEMARAAAEGPAAKVPTGVLFGRLPRPVLERFQEICDAYGASQNRVLNRLVADFIRRYDAALAAQAGERESGGAAEQ